MTALPTARIARPSLHAASSESLLPFLIPSARCTNGARHAPLAQFSTSPALWKRDNNKNRGTSILRHTGPRKRQTLSVIRQIKKLPKPVKPTAPLLGDEHHGLWDFFRDKQLLQTPLSETQHGRAWTVPELRKRTWPDLHSLWWVCVKERNRLATEKIERARLKAGYGDTETQERDETVQATMRAILDALSERQNAWEEAHALANRDPSINLARTDGPQHSVDAYDTEELDDPQESTAKQDGERLEGKDLPEKRFFNTQDNPPSIQERAKEKAQRILWNK